MSYKKARRIFALILILSLSIFLATLILNADGSRPPGFDGDDAILLGTIFGAVSALAAMISAIGTVATTILAWRQDKRLQIEHEMKAAAAGETHNPAK